MSAADTGADLRISDADRDQAIARLSEHFQAGRLTTEEFDERSGKALQAKTGRELAVLFTDLPPAQAGAAQAGTARAGTVARHTGWRMPALPIIVAVIAVSAIGVSVGGNNTGVHIGFGGLLPLVIVLLIIRRFGGFGGGRGSAW
jgi:Domain of unknown function (DUF1707)